MFTLFVSIPPKFSVSDTVQYFKGYSARKIFLEFPWLKQFELGEKRFWGGHLWSRGYFFRSVGSTTDKAVEFYVKSVKTKNKEKNIILLEIIKTIEQQQRIHISNSYKAN